MENQRKTSWDRTKRIWIFHDSFWILSYLPPLRREPHDAEFLALNVVSNVLHFWHPLVLTTQFFYVACTDITFITGVHSQTITYNSLLERLTLTAGLSGWCAKSVAFCRKSLPTYSQNRTFIRCHNWSEYSAGPRCMAWSQRERWCDCSLDSICCLATWHW